MRDGYDWKKLSFSHRQRNIGTMEKPFFVWEDEIPGILNDRGITRMINMYLKTKRWGLPSGRGWANEPAWVMDVLDTLEDIEIKHGKRTAGG